MSHSAQRCAKIALAALFLVLVALGYFLGHLPLWTCVLITLAAIAINSFILRVEDGEYSNPGRPKP